MPAGAPKKRSSAPASAKRAPPPPAAPSSGEDDFSDAADSEEDEWAAERTHAGPSRSRSFEQDEDEDEDDEMGELGSDEGDEDGVAAYESDQGELIEDDSDPEVRPSSLSRVAVSSTDPLTPYRLRSASVRPLPLPSLRSPRLLSDPLVSPAELAEIPFTSLLKAQKQLKKQQGKNGGKGKARDEDEGGPEEESAARHGRARKGKGKGRAEHEGRSNKHACVPFSLSLCDRCEPRTDARARSPPSHPPQPDRDVG